MLGSMLILLVSLPVSLPAPHLYVALALLGHRVAAVAAIPKIASRLPFNFMLSTAHFMLSFFVMRPATFAKLPAPQVLEFD